MLLARTPTPVVEAPPPGRPRVPALSLYLDSLSRVEALEIATVYPGHGAPFSDHRALIHRQQARIQQRKGECLDHVIQGASTLAELMTRMYPIAGNRVNLAGLWMLVGYLDLLAAEGRIAWDDGDPVWRYRVLTSL